MTRQPGTARAIDLGIAVTAFSLGLLFCVFLYLVQLHAYGARFWSQPSGLMLRDFGFFWGGARLAWLGHATTVFDPNAFNAWLAQQIAPGTMEPFATWSYPPTMLLPLLPFGAFQPAIALVLWLVATFGLLAFVLAKIFADRWLVLAILLSPAAFYSLSFGQNGALTAALLIAGLWMVDVRPVIAGICFGLLTIKPQLGILLPFVLAAGGRWRAFASAATTAVAMFALTLVLFGIEPWNGFFHNTVPHMSAQLLHEWGIPPQHAMPTMLVTLQGWGLSTRLAGYGQGLCILLAVGAVTWAWRLRDVNRNWRNAMVCIAVLLATPFGYVYDMIPALLAVALLARAGFRDGFRWWERPVLVAVWVWPAITVLWTYYFSLPPIGGFALAALLACVGVRVAQQGAANCAVMVPRMFARG